MKATSAISQKIFNIDDLKRIVQGLRVRGKKIVFTNGVFDLLHGGHLHSLNEAAAYGDFLIVGLNADASVKRLKGDSRPVHDESTRAMLLASLMQVDAVILFDTDTPRDIISALLPDVLVKGGDYKPDEIAGSKEVIANGGRVELISLVPDISTSSLIKKVSGNS